MFSWNAVFQRWVDAGAGTPDSVPNRLLRRPVVGNGIVDLAHFQVDGEDYVIPAEFSQDVQIGLSHPFRQSATVSSPSVHPPTTTLPRCPMSVHMMRGLHNFIQEPSMIFRC